MSTTTGTTYRDKLEAELKAFGLDPNSDYETWGEDASSHGAWLIASLEEVQMGVTVPRPEKLREVAEAFIEADSIWPFTDRHPAGDLIFTWGEGQSPEHLAQAAAVLKKVGVTTAINGQWLNVEVEDPVNGEFWMVPELEDEEE